MTSPGPTASEEPLGSALAIAMTLFVFAAQSFRRACSGSSAGYEMLATKFVAVNAVRPAERPVVQRLATRLVSRAARRPPHSAGRTPPPSRGAPSRRDRFRRRRQIGRAHV